MAAELPLCPLLPVCQVPVLPLEWLPGKTAGLVPGEKLIHGVVVAHGSPGPCNGSTPMPDACNGSELELSPGPSTRGGPCGPAILYTGVVPVFRWQPPGFTVLSGDVLGLIGAGPDIFTGSDLLRSLLKPSQQTSVDLSQITATSLSVCPSPSGSLGLRYHVKTRERRGSSFSQPGLEPNHTGLTAQSLFFLEESCRVKRSDTQTSSNFSNYFKKVLKLQKRSSRFSKVKRLQLKLTNNLQNSYQISSQHQVPKTWVKQHPKTPKTTKTNENPSPSSSMHKLVPFGSKLVPTWFL